MYKKVTPKYYARTILDIDYDLLLEQGIKALFFDLDNTLIPYDINVVTGEYKAFIEELAKKFKIVILSNSRKPRVSNAVKELIDIPYISFAKKPLKFGFKKALKKANVKKEEACAIGDQLMTDVLGANRTKLKASILVYPIKKRSDHILTRTNRRIERYFIRKIKRKTPDKYDEVLKDYVER